MKEPRATGALLFPPLAGPLEFSTGEIILMFALFIAAVLFLPTVAGLIGLYRYRKATPEAERSRKEATFVFLRWAGATIVLGLTLGWMKDLFSSSF